MPSLGTPPHLTRLAARTQGHSLATRLYRTLRENVFLNCSLPAPPGEPHPCRDSVLPRDAS